jgi:hypothetical protein
VSNCIYYAISMCLCALIKSCVGGMQVKLHVNFIEFIAFCYGTLDNKSINIYK